MDLNWTLITVCLISLWISASQAKPKKTLDELLRDIFSRKLPPQPDTGSGRTCGLNKECVPRFQCKEDGTINTADLLILDIRVDINNSCAYLETCCNIPNILREPVIPEMPVELHKGCGYRNPEGVDFRISGDKDGEAQFGEFPWMVGILSYTVFDEETFVTYKCGGSVIAPNVVLTAAHCVLQLEPHELVVRAGEWDMLSTQEVLPHQDAHVKEIIRHELYNKAALHNDIALLILETSFKWQENVRPICLPEPDANFDFSRCFATGWGKDKFGKDGIHQTILKKIDLPVVPRDTCQNNLRRTRLGKYFQLDKSFMCAGGERDKDTCKGDGGSPLVCPDPQNPKRYYQAGMVAWGLGCREENIPGVYANVPYLRNWINEKLIARGIDFSYSAV